MTLVGVMLSCASMAQYQYQQVLDQVEQNSVMLKSLQAQRDAQKASAVGSSLLEDPEVEFGYYLGTPTDIGKRWDLSVSQSFDLPGVYVNKGKVRSLQKEGAEINYRAERIELLKQVQVLCSEIVYHRALGATYLMCVQNAEDIALNYEKRLKSGDCSLIEYNRVKMEASQMRYKMQMTIMEHNSLMNELKVLNGGNAVDFAQKEFAEAAVPQDFESWCKNAEQSNPMMQNLINQMMIAERESKLAKSEMLPRFSVGYASENIVGETFRGGTIGMSVPIWNGTRAVKAAKAEQMSIQRKVDNGKIQFYNHLRGLYGKAADLTMMLYDLRSSLSQFNSVELLGKALEGGEITIEEYLLALDFYIDAQISVLDAQKELDQTMIELNSVLL